MQGKTLNCPLMINNLHCGKKLFRDYVSQVCLAVHDMQGNATQKWQNFVMHMQNVIKIIGKWYAHKDRTDLYKQKNILQQLRHKANVCPLSDQEEQSMYHAIKALN